jgi:hypothetical protein
MSMKQVSLELVADATGEVDPSRVRVVVRLGDGDVRSYHLTPIAGVIALHQWAACGHRVVQTIERRR